MSLTALAMEKYTTAALDCKTHLLHIKKIQRYILISHADLAMKNCTTAHLDHKLCLDITHESWQRKLHNSTSGLQDTSWCHSSTLATKNCTTPHLDCKTHLGATHQPWQRKTAVYVLELQDSVQSLVSFGVAEQSTTLHDGIW